MEVDLQLAGDGDVDARHRLWSDHYEVLRDCAKEWFEKNWGRQAARGDLSIGGTHVLHMVFERMHDRTATLRHGRAWFFRCFYTECVRIVIDYVRRTNKHHDRRAGLQSRIGDRGGFPVDLGVVADVLSELENRDAVGAQVAMLKIFEAVPDEDNPTAQRGLRNQEVADRLGYSLSLVEKRWKFAKAYLMSRLADNEQS